jgi:hypothetical protein
MRPDRGPRDEWAALRPLLVRRAVTELGLDEQTAGEQLDDVHARGEESLHAELVVRLAATLPGSMVAPALVRLDEAGDGEVRRVATAQLFRTVAPAVAQVVLAEARHAESDAGWTGWGIS